MDVDPRNGGTPELGLPATLTARTANGGWHFYYVVGTPLRSGVLMQGVDLKAEGGYVLAPPSLLTGDRHYRWERVAPLAEVPGERLVGEGRGGWGYAGGRSGGPPPGWRPFEPAERGAVGEGERHTYLVSVAGWLRARGIEGVELEAAVEAENVRACSPPLEDERELDSVISWAERLDR